ncbi:Protein vip1 [Sporothrix curviconia]|uniref:Protein vip1 n=1 Tax=Sporothrix curviconia TaxID=1260050 RepID=A0ABP0B221_9PEZI
MSSPNTVQVKNVAAATTDKEIKDFFSFCGKITDIQVTPEGESKSATVTFEKDTAAKTALLLNNTQLGQNHIAVTGGVHHDAEEAHSGAERESDELTQEEKPRARIFAEYLAHGYVIGDAALQSAIELDHKHGVSSRFASTLNRLDQKYHATDRAKSADQSYGISQRANSLLTGFGSYFEKATNTPTGRRVVDFYTKGQRQVQDIHTEARRLADIKKGEHGGSAYKAAGFNKIFGEEKKTAGGESSAAAAPGVSAPASGAPAAAAVPAVPAQSASTGAPVPSNAPKFDPPPTAPSS